MSFKTKRKVYPIIFIMILTKEFHIFFDIQNYKFIYLDYYFLLTFPY